MAMNFGAAFWFTAMQEHVPAHARSRVSSYDWLGSWLFLPVGDLLVGPVAETIGYDVTLLLAVAWTVASSLAILAIPSVRSLRSTTGYQRWTKRLLTIAMLFLAVSAASAKEFPPADLRRRGVRHRSLSSGELCQG